MTRLAATLLVIALLAGAAPDASAATWLVDGSSPAASDRRRNAAEGPLKTIRRAAELAQPGDIVRVRAGLYRETILLPRSGTSAAPIRFIADPPRSVVVTGADPLSGFERLPGAEPIYAVAWTHRFIAGRSRDGLLIEHHPASEPLWGRAEQVVVDGQQLLPVSDLASLRRAWAEREQARRRDRNAGLRPPVPGLGGPFGGSFAADPAQRRLYLWLADGADPAGKRVEAAVRPVLVAAHPDLLGRGNEHIAFEGFVFRYAANFPQRPAIDLRGRGHLLADCVVEDMSGVGISVHGTVRDCLIRRNGHVGGSAEGAHFLNERTVWEGNSWKPIERGWEAGGVKVTQDGPGEFRDCHFLRNGGPGLWFDLDAHDIEVRNSRFVGNEGSGVYIEISRDIAVLDSVMTGNATGAIGDRRAGWGSGGIAIAESLRATVRGNVIAGNRDGIALREQGARPVTPQAGGEIAYHNAGHEIVENRVSGNLRHQLAFWWDNVFFGPHPTVRPITPETPYDPMRQNMRIDRNRYAAPPGTTPILYGAPWRPLARSFADLAEFVRATGFEQGGNLVFGPGEGRPEIGTPN